MKTLAITLASIAIMLSILSLTKSIRELKAIRKRRREAEQNED